MPTSGPLKIGGQIPSKSSKPSEQEGRILPIKRSFASTVMLRGLQPPSPSWLGNSTEAFTSEIVSLGQKYFKTRLKRLEHRQGMTGTSSSTGYNTHKWADLHPHRSAVADEPFLAMPFSVPGVSSLPPSPPPPPAPSLPNYHLMFSICTIGAMVLPDLTGMRACLHV